jgi:class 3 adenylate cyclase
VPRGSSPDPRFALSRLSLRFLDPAVERDYARQHVAAVLPSVRLAFLVGLVVIPTKLPTELALWPERGGELVRQRLLVAPLYLLGILGLTWWEPFRRRYQLGMSLAFVGFLLVGILPLFSIWPLEYARHWSLTWVQLLVFSAFLFGLDFRSALPVLGATLALFAGTQRAFDTPAEWATNSSSIFGVVLVACAVACYQLDRRARMAFAWQQSLLSEKERSETILLNILPTSIARRLQEDSGTIADAFADASVLFADIVGFSRMTAESTPGHMVRQLDRLFGTFDQLVEEHGLEKIKTVGDAYMVAGSVPVPSADHVDAMARLGLAMLDAARRFSEEEGVDLQLRVGLHAGPVVAGVIGRKRFLYDIWGDTVNVAARMESQGVAGRVQVSDAVHARLGPGWALDDRGVIELRGRGPMRTWLLQDARPPHPPGEPTG